jgi:hypothetical protein
MKLLSMILLKENSIALLRRNANRQLALRPLGGSSREGSAKGSPEF